MAEWFRCSTLDPTGPRVRVSFVLPYQWFIVSAMVEWFRCLTIIDPRVRVAGLKPVCASMFAARVCVLEQGASLHPGIQIGPQLDVDVNTDILVI